MGVSCQRQLAAFHIAQCLRSSSRSTTCATIASTTTTTTCAVLALTTTTNATRTMPTYYASRLSSDGNNSYMTIVQCFVEGCLGVCQIAVTVINSTGNASDMIRGGMPVLSEKEIYISI